MIEDINQLIKGLKPPEHPGSVSDGYHTFQELYRFRKLYNALLFAEWAKDPRYKVHKSWHHSDGEVPFGNPDYFIVVALTPTGQISNHYRAEHWEDFKIPETPRALLPYDGHSSSDCADRMQSMLDEN